MRRSILAMITSASNSDWPLDVNIQDLEGAGLPSASVVRMKLFTMDDKLVVRKAGEPGKSDRSAVSNVLRQLLDCLGQMIETKKRIRKGPYIIKYHT